MMQHACLAAHLLSNYKKENSSTIFPHSFTNRPTILVLDAARQPL